SAHLYCPMIDARRMEVYAMFFDNEFSVFRVTEPVILEEGTFEKILDNNSVLFFGSGSDKFKRVCSHEHAQFIANVHPSAEDIGLLAIKEFEKSNFENVIGFE